MRGNITWTRALQPDLEEVRSWRFCRAQIVGRREAWAPIFWWTHRCGAYILIGAEISTSALFLSYIMWRSKFTIPHRLDANICRVYFGNPPTFDVNIWRQHLTPTFAAYICRLYFESPPIFWASANILCMCKYFRQVPIFDDFLQWVLLSFCCCKYLCIFSVFIYAFLCAPIFLAQLFWSLGLRLM